MHCPYVCAFDQTPKSLVRRMWDAPERHYSVSKCNDHAATSHEPHRVTSPSMPACYTKEDMVSALGLLGMMPHIKVEEDQSNGKYGAPCVAWQ